LKKPSSKTRGERRRADPRRESLRRFDAAYLASGVRVLAGVDEAGRGPLAGPVVACAAIVRDTRFRARIDDSKKLTPLQRERAFDEVLKKCVLSTAVVPEDRIDAVNIFAATLEAMRQAMTGLRPAPDLILVDGIAAPDAGVAAEAVPDGDARSLSIACASIAAKVTRDRIMDAYHERYPEYGFLHHKGYGTPEHLEALRRHGPCPIHRRSFAPVAEAGWPA
jgi:ribonuclease HII